MPGGNANTTIAGVESLLLGGAHFVRITTDNGLVGLGQSGAWGYPESSHAVVEVFREYLVGQDARRTERHWQHLYRMAPFRGSILSGALSAVDMALWDIKGQHLGTPIWDLLGGKYRDKVRLFLLMGGGADPAELTKRAKAAVAEGFTAVKFDPVPENHGDLALDRLIAVVRENVAVVRETVGSDVDVILEIHRKFTPLVALPVLEALRPFNPLFVEDPIQIDSIQSQAEIAKRLTLPIANGERLHTIWEFRELLEAGGSQYVRPDVGLAGGITGCQKIAAIAESYHSALVTHNFLGPVITAAAIHLDVAVPNFVAQEYTQADESAKWRGFTNTLKREGGYMLAPEAPGLGISLTDVSVSESLSPLKTPRTGTTIRRDGSVARAV